MLCGSSFAVGPLQKLRCSGHVQKRIAKQYYIERAKQLLHEAEHTGSVSVPVTTFATI